MYCLVEDVVFPNYSRLSLYPLLAVLHIQTLIIINHCINNYGTAHAVSIYFDDTAFFQLGNTRHVWIPICTHAVPYVTKLLSKQRHYLKIFRVSLKYYAGNREYLRVRHIQEKNSVCSHKAHSTSRQVFSKYIQVLVIRQNCVFWGTKAQTNYCIFS